MLLEVTLISQGQILVSMISQRGNNKRAKGLEI